MNNNTCTYCRALPATGRCGKCATLYCGRACQREDWLRGLHKMFCGIGNKEDVYNEPKQRDPRTAPVWFVGPYMYRWFRWKGIDFWFFGERHYDYNVLKFGMFTEGMDLKVTEEGEVTFLGTRADIWWPRRFFFAIASAAKRKDLYLDIYFEAEVDNEEQDVYAKRALSDLEKTFRRIKCLSMTRSVNVLCDFYPNARVHFGDFRKESGFFGVLYHGIITYFQRCRSGMYDVETKLDEMQGFIDSLGRDWAKHALGIYLLSDNYSQDMFRWVGGTPDQIDPSKSYVDLSFKEYIITELDDVTETRTRVRKQFLRLREENNRLANQIFQWIFLAFDARPMDWIFDLKNAYKKNTNHYESFVDVETWIMDAGLLFRLFRSHGNPSSKRFVYAGSFHIERYSSFFKDVLNADLIDTKGTFEERTGVLTFNDPARDEFQKLLM